MLLFRIDMMTIKRRQWAIWLHQAIETYEIPTELVGKINARGDEIPTQIFPIFRDEQGLPAHADLSHAISQALRSTELLGVSLSELTQRDKEYQLEQEREKAKKLRQWMSGMVVLMLISIVIGVIAYNQILIAQDNAFSPMLIINAPEKHKKKFASTDIEYYPGSFTLVTTSEDQTRTLWNIKNAKARLTLESSKQIYFSPDGLTMASVSDNDVTILWDIKKGEPLFRLNNGIYMISNIHSFSLISPVRELKW